MYLRPCPIGALPESTGFGATRTGAAGRVPWAAARNALRENIFGVWVVEVNVGEGGNY
jgi:hypothetical protein